MLSTGTLKRILSAMCSKNDANEVASAINNGNELAKQSSASIAALIVATSVSTTTDFASLKIGDKLVHIPATPGNAGFEAITVAGTKPSAAVVGDLYIALRASPLPAATTVQN